MQGSISKNGKVVSHIYKQKIIAGAYEVLDYIESSGVQKIDTGIGCNLIKSIDIKFSISILPASGQSSMIYGYYANTYKGCNYLQYGPSSIYIYGNAKSHQFSPTCIPIANKKYRLVCPISSACVCTLYDENDIKLGATSLTTNRETGNMTIFVIGGPATVPSHYSKAKIYSFKMYGLDGELLADYIPVKRLSDGVIGLLNIVNNVFYVNDGSGAFLGEPVYVSKITRLKDGKEVTKITDVRSGKIIEI